MATLAACIDAWTAAQPALAGTVTRKGAAALAVYHLMRRLRALSPEERADILALLCDELAAAPESPPTPSGLRLLGCPHPTSCASVAQCGGQPSTRADGALAAAGGGFHRGG